MAVVGLKTLGDVGANTWIGVAVGEELATRLGTARQQICTLERLQLNELLATKEQPAPMLSLGEESTEADRRCLSVLQSARSSRKLDGADALILGSVICSPQVLKASTRLVSVETGVVEDAIVSEVSYTMADPSGAAQALAVDLTTKWCVKLNVSVSPEMRATTNDKPDTYAAWGKAREYLYQGKYDDCLERVKWAEARVSDPNLIQGLLGTRDEAWEMQFAAAQADPRRKDAFIKQMLETAGSTYDAYKRAFAVAAYYYGRALERAGQLTEAEAKYKECLQQRPARLLWDFEAPNVIFTPVVVDGTAYATSVDGHLRAFEALSGRLLWDAWAGELTDDAPVVAGGVVYATSREDRHLRAFEARSGRQLWDFVAPGWFLRPQVAEGVVYAGSTVDNHLRAFDARRGTVLWDVPLGRAVDDVVVADGILYMGSWPGHLRAFDASDGGLLWEFKAAGQPDTPVIVDGILYVGWSDLHIRAFGARSGELLWDFRAGQAAQNPGAGRAGAPTPVVVDGVAYVVALDDSKVTAIDTRDGKLLWAYGAGAPVHSPIVVDGVAYVESQNGTMTALEAKSGKVRWEARGDGLYTAVVDGVAYAGSLQGRLRAVEATTGNPLWDIDVGEGIWHLTVMGGIVYTQLLDHHLRAFGATTGKLLWDFGAKDFLRDPVVENGIYYVGSHDGHLRAFDTSATGDADYAESATARLAAVLVSQRRPEEAWRLIARLTRESPVRGPAFRRVAATVVAENRLPYLVRLTACDHLRLQRPAPEPEQLWEVQGKEAVLGPVLADGMVYAGSWDHHLRAVEARTGRLVWEFEAGDAISSPTVVGGVAYAGAHDNSLRAFGSRSGKLLWEFKTADPVNGVAVADSVVYASTYQHLHAVDTRTGRLMWDFSPGGDIWGPAVTGGVACLWYLSPSTMDYHLCALEAGSGQRLWDFKGGDIRHPFIARLCPPMLADGVAYAIDGGHLRAFEARSGKLRWEFTADDDMSDTISESNPTVVDGVVYVGSRHHLRALTANSGKLLWQFTPRDWLDTCKAMEGTDPDGAVVMRWIRCDHGLGAPVVADGVAYAGAYDGLRAFADGSGEVLWDAKLGQKGAIHSPLVMGNTVYAISWQDHRLRAFDRTSGRLRWECDADGYPAAADGIVYATAGGALRAFSASRIEAASPPGVTWSSDAQFWSYVIWGKGGLALRKMVEGFPLSQIVERDNWRSLDQLAGEIDRLARLADAPSQLGEWEGPLALSLDPATLCPPEFKSLVRDKFTRQGIPRAAQVYLVMGQRSWDPDAGLAYTREALRLAPQWDEAKRYLEKLSAD